MAANLSRASTITAATEHAPPPSQPASTGRPDRAASSLLCSNSVASELGGPSEGSVKSPSPGGGGRAWGGRGQKTLVQVPTFWLSCGTFQQRLQISRVLLEHAENQGETLRDLVKAENEKLTNKEELVNERRCALGVSGDMLSEFSLELAAYVNSRNALGETTKTARGFLERMRTVLDAQVMTRGGLHTNMQQCLANTQRLQMEGRDVDKAYTECVKTENELNELKFESDKRLRQLMENNGLLKQMKENLRNVKRQATHYRDKWMEVEQLITDAPQRRQQLTEQLRYRELQLKGFQGKLDDIREKTVGHQSQLGNIDNEKQDLDDATIRLREIKQKFNEWVNNRRTPLPSSHQREPLPSTSLNSNTLTPTASSFVTPSSSPAPLSSEDKSEGTSSDLSSELHSVRSLASDIPALFQDDAVVRSLINCPGPDSESAPRLKQLLDEKEEWVLNRRAALRSDEPQREIRALTERFRRAEAEAKKQQEEVLSLKKQLDFQSNPEALVAKSTELQALVRQLDQEVEKKSVEACQMEGRSKEQEANLEAKRRAIRARESEFGAARYALSDSVRKSNEERTMLCHKLISREAELRQLLSDMDGFGNDTVAVGKYRSYTDKRLTAERETREHFRKEIANIIEHLHDMDGILARIDDDKPAPPSQTLSLAGPQEGDGGPSHSSGGGGGGGQNVRSSSWEGCSSHEGTAARARRDRVEGEGEQPLDTGGSDRVAQLNSRRQQQQQRDVGGRRRSSCGARPPAEQQSHRSRGRLEQPQRMTTEDDEASDELQLMRNAHLRPQHQIRSSVSSDGSANTSYHSYDVGMRRSSLHASDQQQVAKESEDVASSTRGRASIGPYRGQGFDVGTSALRMSVKGSPRTDSSEGMGNVVW
eukprot:GHVS01013684.1.p1 GENE.GHVS01013684.1~~GHVS01013684.1.p1  ORF type:complete len:1016 (+),score=187.50 GHVS01013684.1:407-3049(+)